VSHELCDGKIQPASYSTLLFLGLLLTSVNGRLSFHSFCLHIRHLFHSLPFSLLIFCHHFFFRTLPTVLSYSLCIFSIIFLLFFLCFVYVSLPFLVFTLTSLSFPSLSLARMYITVNIWVFERKNYHTSKPNKNGTNLNYAQVNQKVCKLCQHNCVRAGRATRKQFDKSTNKSAQRRPVLAI